MTKYDDTLANNETKPFNTFRKSRIKRTTDQGKVATILKCNTVDTKVAEIFALAQPDAIWLCMEHGSLDYNQAENQSNVAKIYDVDSLLRVNRGSYSNYIRGFEVDCTGLIIPQKNLTDSPYGFASSSHLRSGLLSSFVFIFAANTGRGRFHHPGGICKKGLRLAFRFY